MPRWMSVVALCITLGCSGTPADSTSQAAGSASFVGEWQSVTPSLEFIRLTLVSKSSERDALGARLTLSGIAWEGSGRVTGDSLVANMGIAGSAGSTGTLVIHARDAGTLRAELRSGSQPPLQLTLVRQR